MPELPEVESLRRSLLPFVLGQRVLRVEVKLAKLVSGKGTKRKLDLEKKSIFELGMIGKIISKVDRRNKNLIFSLENNHNLSSQKTQIDFKTADSGNTNFKVNSKPEAKVNDSLDKNLVEYVRIKNNQQTSAKTSAMMVHLKMTGQLVYKAKEGGEVVAGGHPIQESQTDLPHKHTYITFELENGYLYYNDVRQFGYLLYFESLAQIESEDHFEGFGQEPLEEKFDFKRFSMELLSKKSILKKVLLDGKVVVGVGNIYADEICFASKVLPTRKIESLTKIEVKRIFENTKSILLEAVAQGGSSVANYLLADGTGGNYARYHKVYGRGGKPCLVCGNTLQKIVVGGRGTVFCQVCQK